MILVVGSARDGHVAAVSKWFDLSAVEYRIVDPFNSSSNGWSITLTSKVHLAINGANPLSSAPTVVWWRLKPAYVMATESIDAFYDQTFALREWGITLDSIASIYPAAKWINPRASLANNKLHQLTVATSVGLDVPRTLVSNSPEEAKHFLRSLEGKGCIHKTLSPYISPMGRMKYTTCISDSQISELANELSLCPNVFQEQLNSDYELRIMIVGGSVFATRIDSSDRTTPDWRREMDADMYSPVLLPKELEGQLLLLHQRLGLIIGAYDVIVARDGTPYFLEVNPAGQWLWIEEKTGQEITRAVAELLAARDTASSH